MAPAELLTIECLAAVSKPEMPLDPHALEFGRTFSPNHFVMQYEKGEWGNPRIERLQGFLVHPAAIGVHYGQEIFEGLKAFRQASGRIVLFRPDRNARRMNRSAERMAMPAVDEKFFVRALTEFVEVERHFVPEAPGCFYLRPVMFATEPGLGIRASEDFVFFIVGSPSGNYFKEVQSGVGAIDVLVSRSVARAAEGGTGSAKCGGNYAVTLKVTREAKRDWHCAQVLFLDAAHKSRIEEMGGMNIMFVRRGALITPALTDTILPGVTRESLLVLARDLGLDASEETVHIEDVVDGIKSGDVREAIACGTAATVTAIRSFRFEDGTQLQLEAAPGPVAMGLQERLQGIQFGRYPDEHGWLTTVTES